MDEVTFRLAHPADKQDVLAIHDDVFEGSDYLPSYYNIYMQDRNAYCYLAETNGKVVSFLVHYVVDGGHRLISGGARTHPDYQAKGITYKLSEFAKEDTKKKIPQLKNVLWATNDQVSEDKFRAGLYPGCILLRKMVFLKYATSSSALQNLSLSKSNDDIYNATTNHAEERLLSATNRNSLFPDDMIKAFPTWFVFKPTDENIKMVTRMSHTLITEATNSRILAVSYGTATVTPSPKFNFRYDVDLFIDKDENNSLEQSARHRLCMSHIAGHARAASKIGNSGGRISLFLSLPKEINAETVRQDLHPFLGENVRSDTYTGVFSFVFEQRAFGFPEQSKL